MRRGASDSVEYHSWARNFEFHIAVRDIEFWNNKEVQNSLSEMLEWITGDSNFAFHFYQGHRTDPSNLFDAAGQSLPKSSRSASVIPFSGGLDSLAGVLYQIKHTSDDIILVSHQSNNKTKRTQNQLYKALSAKYPGRLFHYTFECNVRGDRPPEESQRTRSFLYCTISTVIALSLGHSKVYMFENGVTSLNLSRRQDQMNSRASRTTHPQTLSRISKVMGFVANGEFPIESPFLWKTKSDIINLVDDLAPELISSTVSCTATLKNLGQASHCGECFQCIDRRLAAYAIEGKDVDHSGLYHSDIIHDSPSTKPARTAMVDYIRQDLFFAKCSVDGLEEEYLSDMAEILGHVLASSDLDVVESVHDLLQRHGKNVQLALTKIDRDHGDVFKSQNVGSLLHVIGTREYFKTEVIRLVEALSELMYTSIPPMFRNNPPENENDFNRKLGALLRGHDKRIVSEHPLPKFALAGVAADHKLEGADLVLESKYIRRGTTPSAASEGIAADLTKYDQDMFILFVVLDLNGAIKDDFTFRQDIESKRKCRVILLR